MLVVISIISSVPKEEYHISPRTSNRAFGRIWLVQPEKKGMEAILIGGERDHTHSLIALPATMSIAKGIQLIKGPSSKWLHEQYPALQQFSWQEGYAAFSVGYMSVSNVEDYIRQ